MRFFHYLIVSLCCVIASQPVLAGAAQLLEKTGSVTFGPISEMSGIVKSKQYDDVYWVHNDSGDKSRLFALDADWNVIIPPFMQGSYASTSVHQAKSGAKTKKNGWPGNTIKAASNIDWEDIATDGDMLYVADMGNNGNARRDLGVYVIPEPNPTATKDIRALKFLPVRFPAQQHYPAHNWHYDTESIFHSDGSLYFISKHRQPGKINGWEQGAVLYRLDTQYTDQYNLLTEVERSDQILVATGADLSPDGRHLAIICYTDIWVFNKPEKGDRWLSAPARRLSLDHKQMKTSEAVTWVNDHTLVLGNEERDLFTVSISDIPVFISGK